MDGRVLIELHGALGGKQPTKIQNIGIPLSVRLQSLTKPMNVGNSSSGAKFSEPLQLRRWVSEALQFWLYVLQGSAAPALSSPSSYGTCNSSASS